MIKHNYESRSLKYPGYPGLSGERDHITKPVIEESQAERKSGNFEVTKVT